MSEQPSLCFFTPELDLDTPNDPWYNRAVEWISLNRDAWDAMVARARALHAVGAFVGMKALIEWARCEIPIVRPEHEQFAARDRSMDPREFLAGRLARRGKCRLGDSREAG